MASASPFHAFLTPFRVRSYELDGLGHVNHAVYLNYLEQARFETLAASGFPLEEMEARGWAVHVVRIEADYRRECRFGDALVVRTEVDEFRKSSMVLHQELHRFRGTEPDLYQTTAETREPEGPPGDPDPGGNDAWRSGGELALEARVIAVWIGPDRRPMRIPPEARAALAGEAV